MYKKKKEEKTQNVAEKITKNNNQKRFHVSIDKCLRKDHKAITRAEMKV